MANSDIGQREVLVYVVLFVVFLPNKNEPQDDKTNKMTFAPSEDSDQPGHPPSLIGVFAMHSMGR